MPTNAIPLPEPWDYCYEWDGPFGTRKFSTASYNGNRPDRSVPIYTADQMHAHAAAVSAADNAALQKRIVELEEELDNTQEQLHHTIQSQKFWFKAACDAGWVSDQA